MMSSESGSSLLTALVAMSMVAIGALAVGNQQIMMKKVLVSAAMDEQVIFLRHIVAEQILKHGLREGGFTAQGGGSIDYDNSSTEIFLPGNASVQLADLQVGSVLNNGNIVLTLESLRLKPRAFLYQSGIVAANIRKFYLMDLIIRASVSAGPVMPARISQAELPVYAVGDQNGVILSLSVMGTFNEACMDQQYQRVTYQGNFPVLGDNDPIDRQHTFRLSFSGVPTVAEDAFFVAPGTENPTHLTDPTFTIPEYADNIDKQANCDLAKFKERPAVYVAAWLTNRLMPDPGGKVLMRRFSCTHFGIKLATEGGASCGI